MAKRHKNFCLILMFGFITGVITLAGADEKVDIKYMEKEIVGKYLADGSGRSLYAFVKDDKNSSNCLEGCAVNWPPFHVDLSAAGEGLNMTDFAVITRTDGKQQTTYKGMPLYYFSNDRYPGDTFGEGLGESWFLIRP